MVKPLGRPLAHEWWEPELPPSRTLALPGGGEVFVRHAEGPGDGVPVLLLHGWTWSADINYFGVYGPLSERHPVVALDHRGHGRHLPSPTTFEIADVADDAAAVLDHLEIERAIVCGFSLGGPVGVELARRHPDRVAGMVVSASALCYRQTGRDRMAWRLMRAGTRVAQRVEGRNLPARAYGALRRDPDFARRWPWLRAELARTTLSGIVAMGGAVDRCDLRGSIAELRDIPSAYVVTAKDTICQPWMQRAFAEELGSEIIELEADHFVPVTYPEAYAEATLVAVESVHRRIRAPETPGVSPGQAGGGGGI